MKKQRKIITSLSILVVFGLSGNGQSSVVDFTNSVARDNKMESINNELVDKFYAINQHQLFWFSPTEQSLQLRQQLKNILDSSISLGLNKEDYHYKKIMNEENNIKY